MFAVPDVETFITQNRVDQRAGDELRNADMHTQAKVLERGDLSEARNPSALLLARIREAAAGTASDPDVLKFIMTHGIDDQAAQVLLSCPVQVKHYVLKQGGFGDARSPSAIVLARIRDGRNKLGLNMDVAGSGVGGISTNVDEADIEAFINESSLDERAISEFRKCSPEVQAQCVSRGELKSARNPSATLLSRISQLRHMQLNYGVGGDKPGLEDWQIEAWLAEAGVDERAEGEFKGLSPPIQSLVMQKGSLKSATNPSAVLLTRIKQARTEIQQYPPASQKRRGSQKGYWNQGHQQVGSLEKTLLVEMFINQSGVDESAAAALRTCSPDVQEAIINRGELTTARNPSAVLLKRVRECNDDAMKGKGASSSGGKGWGVMQSKAASYNQNKLEEENKRLRQEISEMKAQVNHINILEAITQLTQGKKARHW